MLFTFVAYLKNKIYILHVKTPNRGQKSHILVINKVRVLGSGPHTSPQLFWEYSPGAFPVVTDELQAFKRKETSSQFKQKNLTMLTAGSL